MSRQRWYPTMRRVPVDTPAAGVNFSRLNDSGGGWLIRAVTFRLATAAAVAARVAALIAIGGEDRWFASSANVTQAALTTVDYSAWSGGVPTTVVTTVANMGLPTDGLWLPPGHTLTSEVMLLQAADQLSAIILDLIEYPERLPEHLIPMPPMFTENDQE